MRNYTTLETLIPLIYFRLASFSEAAYNHMHRWQTSYDLRH